MTVLKNDEMIYGIIRGVRRINRKCRVKGIFCSISACKSNNSMNYSFCCNHFKYDSIVLH